MTPPFSFDSAYRQVKRGALAPVYYLTGDEDVLKDELVDLIVAQAVDAAARDFNVDTRAAGDVDGEQLHALVETPPMLAERRAVVIRNVEQWRRGARVWDVLERYLQRPSPSTVLILIHGSGEKPERALTQAAAHVAVEALSAERIVRWVGVRAERAGLRLTPEAVELLVAAVGGDLGHLATEIDKLATLSPDGATLTAADVGQVVGVRFGETPHDWVAAVLAREIPRAVRMIEPLLAAAGVSGVRLVMLLGTHLVGVRLAAEYLSQGMPARRAEAALFAAIRQSRPPGLGDWKAEAKRWVEWAGRWTPAELDLAIQAAYDADRQLKSTTVSDDAGIVTTLILGLTQRRRAA